MSKTSFEHLVEIFGALQDSNGYIDVNEIETKVSKKEYTELQELSKKLFRILATFDNQY